MIRLFLFSGMIALLMSACSSGKTALQRGQYDVAVRKAAERLRQGPGLSRRGHGLASLVLEKAFVRGYEQHQTRIRRLSSSENPEPFRWEAVHAEYEALQALTDNALKCTTCADWLTSYPTSYSARQLDTRELAAADRYRVAEEAFAYRETDRRAAKEAYLNYRKAAEWVPNYRQTLAKSEDVLPFAILRVVVEPLGATNQISPTDNLHLEGMILREIGRNPAPSAFVRLYAPTEYAGDGYAIHEAVQMLVTDYDDYNDNTSSSSTTVYSNQTYKVGEKKINDSTTVDIMEKVSGTLTTYRREVSAGLTLRLRAVDAETGRELWNDAVWETERWATEWQTFSGDDRALNGSSLKSANLFPPSRWSLYDELRDALVSDVARCLRRNYERD
ncbi:hypothetical protein [Spirosoma utsteinense]|uniref:Lipoprotein n=1 Tax=Spirosoma utsteinense TaxID=2585773 RepID=A0ABR6WDF6_9BACT|nr:hypothetical protein [Spirosoma utsteinense]MBC3785666.1 hypothetical protein [Spirosoma utsteinense]MBC3794600.1 hypothetical protein [Spirosoma utsteinense]